jgi:hypothetical protein
MAICKRCKAVKSDEKMAIETHLHLCISCYKGAKWRSRRNKENKMTLKEARDIVLSHYGAICACCGEKEKAFLEIDHINNDGADHRKEIGRKNICIWIIENGYPKGRFQILCANCNHGKYRAGGICPHERERQRMTEPVEITMEARRLRWA